MIDPGPTLTMATTADGYLLVLALVLPVVVAVAAPLVGGRRAADLFLLLIPAGLLVAVGIVVAVVRADAALLYLLGGWAPPLGVALRADGLSAALLLTSALVIGMIGLYARPAFATPTGTKEARAPLAFWTLLPALWGGLNAVFLSNDLFSLYVALELLTFTAIPLVCLDGRAETLGAALRYLLFALVGSALYLLGTALLYGAYGTLDIVLLAGRIGTEPTALIAIALMTVGLLAKTALFPLYLWLPPAHAGAPAAASAVLSGLVVKASLFIVMRLWLDLLPGLATTWGAQLLAALGAAAILFGSVLALRQARLKMLIAYSTVAQIGYLFLMFPLVAAPAMAGLGGADALTGGTLQIVSHALAKAAMFLAAGLMAEALGHDRIAGLGGLGRALPLTLATFALAGLSLMGLPPSGGFLAKWLLLTAAIVAGQWWWALVMLAGGLLTGAYLYRVLVAALAAAPEPAIRYRPIARWRELVPLVLAVCSVLLGLVAFAPVDLVPIGRP
ncbi:proton-conducting transporter membrane subunit [Thioalkalicoccus limnaeus]|uniref:Proton-conducting transporter membrane subunit n=1 Tax=Thioalkalicoccus limnaeus TaxID=120681 RepID=A0ABV4BJX5_9GAMM